MIQNVAIISKMIMTELYRLEKASLLIFSCYEYRNYYLGSQSMEFSSIGNIYLPVIPDPRMRQGDHELLQPGLCSETLSQQIEKRKGRGDE